MNLLDEVMAIVARIRDLALEPEDETAQIREAIEKLPEMETSDRVHRYRELMIQVGWGEHLRGEAAALERVRPLELAAAPEVTALIPTAEGYVIIRRYWACPGETLVRVESSPIQFSKQASARFRSEMERIFAHGLYHAYARGFHHWWVAEPSGTIVLDSWFALRPCSERDRAEQLELIGRRLDERAAS